MDNSKLKYVIILVVLVAVLGGISIYLSSLNKNQNLQPAAGNTATFVQPAEVILSNLTSNTATISWYTPTDATGYVKFGKTGALKTIQNDFRDTDTANLVERPLHYVTLIGLDAATTYDIEVYSNDTAYPANPITQITTLAQNDTLSTPKAVAVTAQSDFSEGIVYSHAKNDNGFSTTISEYATTNTISLTISNMKAKDTGAPFDLTGANFVVSLTDPSGKRSRQSAAATATSMTMPETATTGIVYAAATAIPEPTTVVATDTNTDTGTDTGTDTTGGNTANNPPPVTPAEDQQDTPPPAVPASGSTQLPATAIDSKTVQFAQAITAIAVIGIGLHVRKKKVVY